MNLTWLINKMIKKIDIWPVDFLPHIEKGDEGLGHHLRAGMSVDHVVIPGLYTLLRSFDDELDQGAKKGVARVRLSYLNKLKRKHLVYYTIECSNRAIAIRINLFYSVR